ncbi:unnamed protein product [Hydatigera taeniaeformis]|uniref:CRC domain-containing protein n=1 Tax=Hydatigena taeniaeformis TaxID=6205 RepID=A0A0R3WK66_HYDTA|nr:unnamed protein product [Hydatigera taeniaeformis]
MFDESNADVEKDLVLLSHTNDENQGAEYTWSQSSAGCDMSSISSDQQNQVAVVQALMDLNASAHISYPSTDTYSQQNYPFEVPQKYEKKSCNCAKSHCLKLYCECFAKGQSCDGCNCSNCMNNFNFEDDRRKAIKSTLERNPLAFYPKIGSSVRKHSKGCNCKRSNCLKNYCECYEKAKISCSDLCKCRGCRNFIKPSHPDPVQSADSEIFSQFYEKFFAACITSEVIEVACSCMLSQLFTANQRNMSDTDQEHVVLAEFAKCLNHILESVNKVIEVFIYKITVPVQLRNARFSVGNCGKEVSAPSPSYSPRVTEKPIACVYPSYPLQNGTYVVPSEFPISLPYSAGNSPDVTCGITTLQDVVSTAQTYGGYDDFLVSSEMSEASLPQYDPNYANFQTVLSPGLGDASNAVELSGLTETMENDPNGPTIIIPHGMLSSSLSELRSHLLPSSAPSSPLPLQQSAYPLEHRSFFMASSNNTVSCEDTICYPLTYSTEANLAAAAISSEVDPTLAADRSGVCNYSDDFDDTGGYECTEASDGCFHPNMLDLAYYSFSTPLDLIPAKF